MDHVLLDNAKSHIKYVRFGLTLPDEHDLKDAAMLTGLTAEILVKFIYE